jgi:hypothetical protein
MHENYVSLDELQHFSVYSNILEEVLRNMSQRIYLPQLLKSDLPRKKYFMTDQATNYWTFFSIQLIS